MGAVRRPKRPRRWFDLVVTPNVQAGALELPPEGVPPGCTLELHVLCWLFRRSASSRGYLIVVVKPTKNGHRDDLGAFTVDLTSTWNRDLLNNPLVRATRIEIVQSVLFKDVLHVPSSENDDVVQTFASGTANESFTNGLH